MAMTMKKKTKEEFKKIRILLENFCSVSLTFCDALIFLFVCFFSVFKPLTKRSMNREETWTTNCVSFIFLIAILSRNRHLQSNNNKKKYLEKNHVHSTTTSIFCRQTNEQRKNSFFLSPAFFHFVVPLCHMCSIGNVKNESRSLWFFFLYLLPSDLSFIFFF